MSERENAALLPLCLLRSSGHSHTATEAFNWAADMVAGLRGRVDEVGIDGCQFGRLDEAVLTFSTPECMRLHVVDEANRVNTFEFRLGQETAFGEWSVAIPDAADALHLVGIMLDALGVGLQAACEYLRERNDDLLPDDFDHYRPALADHQRQRASGTDLSNDQVEPMFAPDSVYTSLEMFNWVADTVKAIQSQLGCVHEHALLRAYRSQGEEWLDFVVSGERPGVFLLSFVRKTAFYRVDSNNFVCVPSIAHAMHLVHLLAVALAITSFGLGERSMESNPALLELPMNPDQIGAMMARADHQRPNADGG